MSHRGERQPKKREDRILSKRDKQAIVWAAAAAIILLIVLLEITLH